MDDRLMAKSHTTNCTISMLIEIYIQAVKHVALSL